MAAGIYNYTMPLMENSPTSVVVCSLTIDNNNHFIFTSSTLADTPAEYDWRSQWTSVSGTIEIEGSKIKFNVEKGRQQIKSSAWSGRGEEDLENDRLPAIEGEINQNIIKLNIPSMGFSPVTLNKGNRVVAEPCLIFPDYIFG